MSARGTGKVLSGRDHTSGRCWRPVWIWMLPFVEQLFRLVVEYLSRRIWISLFQGRIPLQCILFAVLDPLCLYWHRTVIECRLLDLSIDSSAPPSPVQALAIDDTVTFWDVIEALEGQISSSYLTVLTVGLNDMVNGSARRAVSAHV